MSISDKRLRELERAESKLKALESGGVDNWEWYDDSLKNWRLENERDELVDDFFNELEEAFGCSSYEPSEVGAGVCFKEGIDKEVKTLIYKFISDLAELT